MALQFRNPKCYPNQTKFASGTSSERYQIKREREILDTACKEGFVHSVAENDIVGGGIGHGDSPVLYPGDVCILNLPHQRIKDISILDLCQRLQVCNLPGNFLHNIDALKWCKNLICLDLHTNQITKVPGAQFWSKLQQLWTLYLHDNGISKFDDVKNISSALRLNNLTLYDTPLSLKKNYRHCVVNAVWSLNALDGYVISDEEIIEDAHFPSKFKPLQQQFQFKSPYLKLMKKAGSKGILPAYRQVMGAVYKELSMINSIQSKWCPVLILQRYIRGFLTRLRFHYLMDTRLWAAVSIQRFYRRCKGYPNPPPCTPITQYQDALFQSLSSIRLDYETYLQMRRSRHKSILSFKSELAHAYDLQKNAMNAVCTIDSASAKRRHISIDLDRLEAQTEQVLDDNLGKLDLDKSPRLESWSQPKIKNKTSDYDRIARELGLYPLPDDVKHQAKDNCRVGKYFTQYKFLGEVVEPVALDDNDSNKSSKDIRDGDVSFRLTVRKPPVLKHGMLEELVLRTIEGADDIRQSVKVIEQKNKAAHVPVKHAPDSVTINKDQRLFLKTHGTMGFGCFRAVEQAYRDRCNAERAALQSMKVKEMKDARDMVKDKRARYLMQYRNKANVSFQAGKVVVLDAVSSQIDKQQELQKKVAEQRQHSIRQSRKTKSDYKFALEFRCQNASIGKALQAHNRQVSKEKQAQDMINKVSEAREWTEKQKVVIKNFMEHTKIVRQAENIAERERLESVLTQAAVQRDVQLMEFIQSKKQANQRLLISPTLVQLKEAQPFADSCASQNAAPLS